MNQKLIFDDGIREYEINDNGVLRFNPSDPNVYDRFCSVLKELQEIEKEYERKISDLITEQEQKDDFAQSEAVLSAMHEYDARIKGRLSHVFGTQNDFDVLLGGVNLMAIGRNGDRIITNLLSALMPIMESGIREQAKDEAAAAVQQAQLNRAQRRAAQ